MSSVALVVSLVVGVVALASGAWGALLWWRFDARGSYWIAVRTTQVGALALAVTAGVVWVSGEEPTSWLFWLYSLMPVAISLVAEQLRLIAAEQVLERRGLDGAADVALLDDAGQRGVVREIVRREIGVMASAAFVIAFLALRVTVERGGL
ncbi:hypothetical protein [Patulibacter sp.]|uniref:hypothetical protein n=1 Tax=Patulibacter sp. TaxID=1912859 RepID=UPI00271E1789|nr:hypothetical protein [Patulibacter sp.]MDO9407209.1 hypothetical protein [Patulibacter sp.]